MRTIQKREMKVYRQQERGKYTDNREEAVIQMMKKEEGICRQWKRKYAYM